MFKVGDRVKALTSRYVEEGSILNIVEHIKGDAWITATQAEVNYINEDHSVRGFELVQEEGRFKFHTNSIERPILEERKLGKVRMELFDSGFPNAILEIAKVMTWANQNKGYKDNDWKALPNAENGFKGAAARHRVKFDAQRAMGFEPLACVDEESNITHLAHECFNNLALLESVLMGKIK